MLNIMHQEIDLASDPAEFIPPKARPKDDPQRNARAWLKH